MSTRWSILVAALAFTSQVFAADFPTGTLKGVGFMVEKGGMHVTEKDLHFYSSSATIVKRSDGKYEFTIVAHLQKSPSTPQKTDTRVDVFNVVWDSASSGKLLNTNAAYQADRSTFTITSTELVIKSWISRNQLWETHRYLLSK